MNGCKQEKHAHQYCGNQQCEVQARPLMLYADSGTKSNPKPDWKSKKGRDMMFSLRS
jgi:hypothetical protein